MVVSDQSPLPCPDTDVAIMFVDIVGSTRLYDTMGNDTARKLVGSYLKLWTKIIEQHRGVIIKSTGDGVLGIFEDSGNAVFTAQIIHNLPATEETLTSKLKAHIGIHFGEIIFRSGDIYGDAVNIAARISDIAKSGQTLASETLMQNLPSNMHVHFRYYDKVRLKGKREPITLFELINENDDHTVIYDPGMIDKLARDTCLTLKMGNQSWQLDSAKESITIGRTRASAITIALPAVSRQHAAISLRRGKFIFSDQSTNGSFITTSDADEIFLRREDYILRSNGVITFGEKLEKTTKESCLFYSIQ